MAIRQRVFYALLSLTLLAAIAFTCELWRWHQVRGYNAAVTAEQFAKAGKFSDEYGTFARGYAAHVKGQHQAARMRYGEIEHAADTALRRTALFNMGNTYLEEAALIDIKKDADLALPLIELAKASYRELLREDPTYWDAKFNLERALRLLPDALDKKVVEIEGRRGTVRTVISADTDQNLP